MLRLGAFSNSTDGSYQDVWIEVLASNVGECLRAGWSNEAFTACSMKRRKFVNCNERTDAYRESKDEEQVHHHPDQAQGEDGTAVDC